MQVDSDGNAADLAALISQIFEFFSALAGSARFQRAISKDLQHLMPNTLGKISVSVQVHPINCSVNTHSFLNKAGKY